MTSRLTIVVVERDPIYRLGIVGALKADLSMDVVAEGATAEDAVHICLDQSPEILLLGIQIARGGIAVAQAVSAGSPKTNVIILSELDGDEWVRLALQAGVRGCLLKSIAGPALIEALQAVRRGETRVATALAASPLGSAGDGDDVASQLTHRECQVLECVGRGLTNKEVAGELGLSEKTVKQYMSNIMEKLHVRNRVEAVILSRNIRLPP